MERYFAGIDAGTTGTTVMIFDKNGNVLSSGYSEYQTKHPHSGWVDQDMYALWEGVINASAEATSSFKGDIRQVVSIGLSSQRGSFVPIDEEWAPLSDAIVWSDGRATKETEWIKKEIGKDEYYKLSGQNISSLWAYAKIMWLKTNQPNIYEKAWKFVNGQEWILNRLGANEMYTVPSALNYNGMFDIESLEWSEELMKKANIDMDKLVPILHDLRPVGSLSKQAAARTGFAEGTPLSPGGGDQQCAAVGSGVNQEGIAEISIGTSAVMVAQLDERPDMEKNLQSGVMFGSHAIPGKWDMEGTAHSAGQALRWYRDTFGQVEKDLGEKINIDPYDIITLEASKAPIGCNGLLFFPFFNSQATPYYHDNARGGMLGISQVHDRHHAARAVLEGVVYELRMSVEAMEATLERPFETIRLSGGGAKSDFWNQMQADVYGRPVEKLKVSECAVLGAAILGAVGAGEMSSIDSAINDMVHTHGVVEPSMENHEKYTKMYELFRKAFLALRDADFYNDLADVTMELNK